MAWRNRTAFVGLCFASSLASAPALAQSPAGDSSDDADALFQSAVRNMDEAHCLRPAAAERVACLRVREQFSRVYARSPLALGALRNRAFIEKSLGLFASAVSSFRELARVAPGHPDPARRQWATFAQTEAVALESRVPVLVLEVRGAVDSKAALLLDSTPLPFKTTQSLRLDPGPHVLVLKVETRSAREIRVDLSAGERARVIVDLSKDGSPLSVTIPARETAGRGSSNARGWALGLGVSGGVLIVSGLAFGTAAWIQKREACGGAAVCDPSGYASAARSARYANVLVGTGLLVAAGGLGLYVVAPRATRTSLALEAAGVF